MFFTLGVTYSGKEDGVQEDIMERTNTRLVDFDAAVRMARGNSIVAMESALAVLLLKEKVVAGEISL